MDRATVGESMSRLLVKINLFQFSGQCCKCRAGRLLDRLEISITHFTRIYRRNGGWQQLNVTN